VRLRDDAGGTVLEVEDDGRGIAPGRPERVVRDGHIGLASWAERVAAMGGTFAIESEPGEGALVRATLPPAPLP
jgi:signal transduction histidine kinase